jgi:hypothetical protein
MKTNLTFTNITTQRLIEIQKLIIKKNGTIHNIDTNISDVLYSGTIRCSWPNTKTGRGNMTRFFLSIQESKDRRGGCGEDAAMSLSSSLEALGSEIMCLDAESITFRRKGTPVD